MKVAVAPSRFFKVWVNQDVTYEAFKNGLKNPKVTSETMEEYRKMRKDVQDNIKDVGGFVGGELKDGKRGNGNVVCRSMLTLDIDYGTPETIGLIKERLTCKAIIYSTHKSTVENPRLRLIIPLSRDVTEEEYEPVARKVAEEIGIDLFDDSTYQPARLMYLPSVSKDGVYIFDEIESETLLDPDFYLSKYDDWKNTSKYPVSSRQNTLIPHELKNLQDPLLKEGVIGAFCKVYSITEAIDKFLPDVYKESHVQGRYDYIPADSQAGVMIYDDKYVYSHHATDPASNKLLNAFDICRIHLFSKFDVDIKPNTPISKYPSFIKMSEFALEDENVKAIVLKEKQEKAKADFDDEDMSWMSSLEYKARSTVIANTLNNLIIIFNNDKHLLDIKYNALASQVYAKDVPWERPSDAWRDVDTAQLTVYLAKRYGTFSAYNIQTALSKVADDRSFHPIKEYLESLPKWDGTERLDTLLIDYFASEDSQYTREVTRKTLVAAVKRVYEPGTKFDTVLILNGDQGIGKSTIFSRLGMEWYSDSLQVSDMKDKTGAEKLQGYWIMELSELAGMKKVDVETIKSFVTRIDDKYRPSFGKVVESHKRQTILVGSTNNESGFLRDITGNRRFWPVKVFSNAKKKPWDLDKDTVNQIWAEAFMRYKDGEDLTLTPNIEDEARKKQEEALESDDREGIVKNYLDTLLPDKWDTMDLVERRNFLSENSLFNEKGTKRRDIVSNIEIWCECFQKDASAIKTADSYQIGAIMRKIDGWERSDERETISLYGLQRIYKRVSK